MNTTNDSPIDRSFSERELYLEQRLADIEAKFKTFQENFVSKPKGKGKGKGKNSKKTEEDLQMQIQAEAEKRLREFLSAQQATVDQYEPQPSTSRNSNGRLSKQINSRLSDDCWTNDSNSIRHIPDLVAPRATKSIYIRKLELTINGTPIDQVL